MAERITINDVVEDGNGIVNTLNNIKTALVGINGEMQKAAGKKKIEITNKTDADSIANATKALEAMRQATESLSKFTAQVNKDLKEMAAAIKGMPKMPSAPKPSSGGGGGSYGGGRGRGGSNLPLGASDTAELARVDAAIKQVTTDTSKAFPAVNQLQTSFNGLSQIADKLSEALNSMSMQERNTTIAGKSMSEQLKAIRDNMNLTQQAVGKFSLNVGNYQSAIAGVQFSTQQILREVPSAINPQQFFLAISNNIPILMDYAKRYKALQPQIAADVQKVTAALNEAKIAQAAAVAGTKEHEVATQNVAAAQEKLNQLQRAQVPVGKQILKSLVSWQTLLIAGLLLLRKVPEIIKKIKEGLWKWKEISDITIYQMQHIAKSFVDVGGKVAKDRVELGLIQDQLKYLVEGTDEWKSAVERVNEITGENLDVATATTDEVYNTIDAYKKLAMQQAINEEVVKKVVSSDLSKRNVSYFTPQRDRYGDYYYGSNAEETQRLKDRLEISKSEYEKAKQAGKDTQQLEKDILSLENAIKRSQQGVQVHSEEYMKAIEGALGISKEKDKDVYNTIETLIKVIGREESSKNLGATVDRLLRAEGFDKSGAGAIPSADWYASRRVYATRALEKVLTSFERKEGRQMTESLYNYYMSQYNAVITTPNRTGRTRRAKTEDYGYSDIGDFYWEQQEKLAKEAADKMAIAPDKYGNEGVMKNNEFIKQYLLNAVATRKALEEQQNAMNKETESVKYNLGGQLKQIGVTKDKVAEYIKMFDDAPNINEIFKGNVDLLNRAVISSQKLVDAGWLKQSDISEGDTATVFSSQYGVGDKEILITPILPNGEVLTEKELEDYVTNVLGNTEDILKADTKGLVLNIAEAGADAGGEYLHKLHEFIYAGAGADNITTLMHTYYEQLTTIERQHQDVLEGIEQEGARKEKEILDARFSWYFKKDVEATEKEMELRKKRQRNRTDEYNNNLITNRNILKLRERLAELEAMDAKGVVEAEKAKREAIEKTTEDIKKQAQAYDMNRYINRDVTPWGMLKNSGYNAGINNAKDLMTPAMLKAGINPDEVTNEQAESWWTSAFDQYTDALKNAKDMTVEYLKEMGDAYVELMERKAEAAREETEEAKTEYEKEKALLEAGYANQVETTWKTYQEKKAIQEQAEQDAKNAQKAMEAVETAQQAVSIATAIAELFKNAASMGPVGVPLAVAASTMLVGSFIAAKAMAAQAANYGDGGFEVLSGGSHASGHDIALGTTNRHGRSMRAEGGEGLGIFSRRAMSRYGAGNIEGVVNAINSGRFGDEAYNSLALGEELGNYAVNGRGEIVNLNRIEKSLANIEKSNENGTFYDKDGNRIEKTPYGTTKYIRK